MGIEEILLQNNIAPPKTPWEIRSPACSRDLILKKIAITIIALINFAALGAALYCIITYCPIPSKALIISPFIVGVLGALAYIKFPTCSVSDRNYTAYVNPAVLVGKGLAYLFFGPLVYAVKRIDWTPYHDPICANRVSNDLNDLPFDQIERKYGSHFSNLARYGFIHKDQLPKLEALRTEYQPIKAGIDFWKAEKMEKSDVYLRTSQAGQKVEKQWKDFKEGLSYPLPTPALPDYDFTQSSTHATLWARKNFCFNNMIHVARA